MPRSIPRLLLATYLATAAAPLIAAPRSRTVAPEVRGTSHTAPAVPAAVWRRVSALWASIGAILDPDGKPSRTTNGTPPTPGTPTTSGDIGAILDPNG